MNAAELSKILADSAERIASHLLPGGKRVGAEWQTGSTSDDAGKSLSVRVSGEKSGVWKDFATGEAGDLLDLWCAVRSCSLNEAIKEAKGYLGIKDSLREPPKRAYKRPEKPKCTLPTTGVKYWLKSRGISEQTIADFKIGEMARNGQEYAVFPFLRDGVLINAKYRNVVDKKDMRQEKDAEPCLFGWHLVKPTQRSIVICEGEVDCMSLHQMGISAMSVNAGAGNHQWIESDWDRLDQFSDIVVMFDNDEAGQKGAKEVVRRLGAERCRIAKPGAKDANDWLMSGATREDFAKAIKEAKHQDPEELVSFGEFFEETMELFYPTDRAHFPYLQIQDSIQDWFEFRPTEYTVWTGINGHGKSLILMQAMIGVAMQGGKVCVFSGEMTPARQLKRLIKQAGGVDKPGRDYARHVVDWINEHFWVFDLVGSASLDRLLEVFNYANKRYGITNFVIDSLMVTDIPDDGAGFITKQKEAVQKISKFAKESGSHVHLVAHPRKVEGGESKAPGKLDVGGSSKITDLAENVFSMWSARKEDDKTDQNPTEPDAKLQLLKQRNGEVQHKTVDLWFVRHSQQFTVSNRRHQWSHLKWSASDF